MAFVHTIPKVLPRERFSIWQDEVALTRTHYSEARTRPIRKAAEATSKSAISSSRSSRAQESGAGELVAIAAVGATAEAEVAVKNIGAVDIDGTGVVTTAFDADIFENRRARRQRETLRGTFKCEPRGKRN